MNKKLIAVAVAGACAAPAAMAQTANPVTLYGVVAANIESVEATGGAAPLVRRNRVEDRVSRLGVRGTEDLGGGLKAFFQLETAFPVDQNNTTVTSGIANGFANRNSAVGLLGGWGSVLLGRWDSPMKSASASAVDPWGDIGLPDVTAASLRQGGFSQRLQNNVQYWSPTFGGFAFKASYSANEGRTATANPSNYGGSVTYTGGPLYLAYSYEKHKDSIGLTTTAGVSEDGNVVAARVAFGPFRIMGNYGVFKRTGTTKQKGFLAATDWTFGNNVLMFSYQKAKDGGATGAAQPECKVIGAGYKYNFSRRTTFIAEYAKVDNNGAAVCNFGQSALAGVTAGQDLKGFGVGFIHTF